MGSKDTRSGKTTIVSSDLAALDHWVPDLANWPNAWSVEDRDIAVGQHIVNVLKPFLVELLRQPMADKTRRRHRDHLCMLGAEVIRRRREDPAAARQSVKSLLGELIEEDGGPLIWPRISESQQNAFDATCRKFYRFLSNGAT